MALPSRRITVYSNGTWDIDELNTQPLVQWYMQQEDQDVFGSLRDCVPCPAVFVLKDDPHVKMGRQWQYYLRAINYNMSLENVFLLLDDRLAFANKTGFDSLEFPGKADFFFNRFESPTLPSLDKVRTTSRSVMTGIEQFRLTQALLDTINLARSVAIRRVGFLDAKFSLSSILSRATNVLNVRVFDSRQNPPLKPGYVYPDDISKVDPNAYLFMPETHPEMFLVANIVTTRGTVVQFPRGATYPWIDGGLTPYSFVPHIAHLGYGPVLYPLSRLYKVPLGSPKPRALRYE